MHTIHNEKKLTTKREKQRGEEGEGEREGKRKRVRERDREEREREREREEPRGAISGTSTPELQTPAHSHP